MRGGAGSLEADLEMSRDYEVKERKKPRKKNSNASKHRDRNAGKVVSTKKYFMPWCRFEDTLLNLTIRKTISMLIRKLSGKRSSPSLQKGSRVK